jgi:predicted amidohydrolase YtcJ
MTDRLMDRPADLLITGRIATLQGPDGFGWVEAIAIGGGRVLAAGRAREVSALATARTRRWNLGEKTIVMPSLTDAHLHLIHAALAAEQPDLTELDLAAAAATVAQRHRHLAATGDVDGWLLGHGWSYSALGGRPHRDLLDRCAPGRPVALWSHDHHTRWLSSAALRLADLASREDPPGGRIERDDAGEATGVMYEAAAGLVDAAIPGPTQASIGVAIGTYACGLAALGVTSVHDPGGVAPDPLLRAGATTYRALASEGRLPLRVIASVREEQLEAAIGMGFRSGREVQGPNEGRYRDGWLKIFSDGALGSRTASLLEPYEADVTAGPPPAGPLGMRLRSEDQLEALIAHAAEAGIASQVHAIGDGAVRAALDVLATTRAVDQVRHRIEHAQLVDPADVLRFAALGVVASVQPSHLISDADAARRAWGARAAMAFPFGDLDRAGTLMPFGTDAPVEPPDPWPGIAAAVTRRGPGWPESASFHPRQAISLDRALRAACLDGPRSAGVPDLGHLAPGARADLMVVPAAPFDDPQHAELAAVRPLATLLDGVPIHRSVDFSA